jgi:hypothetical protein
MTADMLIWMYIYMDTILTYMTRPTSMCLDLFTVSPLPRYIYIHIIHHILYENMRFDPYLVR